MIYRLRKNVGNQNGFKKGQIPWNKGKKGVYVCSPATREKLRKYHKEHPVKYWQGKKFSEEHKKKISRANSGEKSYYWKGGLSRNKQGTPKYRQWRSDIFQRDNWTCQTCGTRSGEGTSIFLEPHHIKSWAKYPELRYNLDNGITLCRECHKLTDNYKGKNK